MLLNLNEHWIIIERHLCRLSTFDSFVQKTVDTFSVDYICQTLSVVCSFSESTGKGTEGWAKYCKEELYNQVHGQAIKFMDNIPKECCKSEKSEETAR